MKSSQINFVGSVIGQLTTVPQHQLTQEYVATLFADRLEARYKTNFNREEFLGAARVSPRMVEDAEEKRGTSAPLTSPREVMTVGREVPASRSDNGRSNSDFLRASQSAMLRGCGGKR